MTETYDVAIVGGGPAGAATAIRLAARGYSVVVLERHKEPRWRACGVFTSPLARNRLNGLGLSGEEIDTLSRSISAMELRSTSGARCRLEYVNGHACGFDRVRLDARLLERAAASGATVLRGCVVREVGLNSERQRLVYSELDQDEEAPLSLDARVVVGADGHGSRVARAAGATSERNLLHRSAITFHVRDPQPGPPADATTAKFVLGRGWYVGLAPVPESRINVGIVVPTTTLHEAVDTVVAGTLAQVGLGTDVRLDDPQVAGRLEHHSARVGGLGWLLVGDACGFIDPLTGEGLHRALVTADLASRAAHSWLSGDRNALADYDRRVRLRFRSKNVFSLFLQAFAANPQVLDYALRRLDRRSDLRERLTAVLTDQSRASDAIDPRFMARLLAP